ncbi:acyl-CoA dehydrogenase family protein [Gordonia rhizosphera]|uniref:Acyl-CoA dehydrogenase n=1 Tax=Gordonia rhizosphera NBRC 16068 TaxID=1108045 RepID=K6W8Q5_9ACTN|nr:acyl-CoA dehydrogenase family protein [Gordonia rhizosphera]GAB88602.1 hypothetical protein GORHZ_030_00070 [Gordonia rhizosphera NBRC 16068]
MIINATELAFRIVNQGSLDVPLPGRGDTATRFRTLADFCHRDIAVGSLVEAHLDADAILEEIAGERVGPAQLWGVWAAQPSQTPVMATRNAGVWELTGAKHWCSGVVACSHALVTADVGDEHQLFAVDLRQAGVRAERGGWVATGMRATETGTALFDRAVARPVGEPGEYVNRPGFWHGGIGVAACWLGGARKVAGPLFAAVGERDDDLMLMHLGAVDALLAQGRALLEQAAVSIDAAPKDECAARRLAFRVRWGVEQIATAVIDRVARALGPEPLVGNRNHAQAVSDLSVYLRESDADRDLVTLGRLATPIPTEILR